MKQTIAAWGTYIYFLNNVFLNECFLTNFHNYATSLCVWKCYLLSHVWLFCDPMDRSLPGFSAHGVLQARIQEWVAVPFSRGSSQPRDQIQVSYIRGRFLTVQASREKSHNITIVILNSFQGDPSINNCWDKFVTELILK